MTCDSFSMTMWINIEDLYASYCTTTKYSDWCHWTCMFFFLLTWWPLSRCGQERSAPTETSPFPRTDWWAVLGMSTSEWSPSARSKNQHFLWTLIDCRKSRHVCTVTFCQFIWPLVPTSSFSHTQTCKTPTNFFTSCRLKTQTHC